MKKTSLLLLILCFCTIFKTETILAQEKTFPSSFTLVGENESQKLAFYTQSVLNASMEQYRLLNTDVTLNFKEGFNCILFSAKKVSMTHKHIDLTKYVESFPANYLLPVFSVATDGHILGEVKPFGKLGK